MNVARVFLLPACLICITLITGCSIVEIPAKAGPAGGALTESIACIYDFDRDGLWYVVFIHEDGLLGAVHRHNPGIHLFLDNADIIFKCRCSGRGEVIDIMGQTFRLSKGVVFLADVEHGNARVQQVPLPAPACDGNGPEAIAKTIYALSLRPGIASFLSDEAVGRLAAEWKLAGKNPNSKNASTSK